MAMDGGILLEYRIARLLFHNNYFSRRGIPLITYSYSEKSNDITDIDVLGIRYNVDFSVNRIFADCKSNISPKSKEAKPASRIFWITGLKKFLNYDIAYFCKPKINERMKDFALKNGIVPIDYKKLEELEDRFDLKDRWQGSYDKSNYQKINSYYNNIKKDPNLYKLYFFLRYVFWRLPPNRQIKRCINLLDENFKEIQISPKYKIYLLCELYSLSAIAVLNLCRETYSYTKTERDSWITNKMIEGIGSIKQQETLLKVIKSYAQAKVEELTQQQILIDLDEFKIPAPEYTHDLIDLLDRFVSKPEYSIEVPRFIDFFVYEYIMKNEEVNTEELKSLFKTDINMLAKLSKNLIRFVDPLADKRTVNEKILTY
jgi:hypothetical protein